MDNKEAMSSEQGSYIWTYSGYDSMHKPIHAQARPSPIMEGKLPPLAEGL